MQHASISVLNAAGSCNPLHIPWDLASEILGSSDPFMCPHCLLKYQQCFACKTVGPSTGNDARVFKWVYPSCLLIHFANSSMHSNYLSSGVLSQRFAGFVFWLLYPAEQAKEYIWSQVGEYASLVGRHCSLFHTKHSLAFASMQVQLWVVCTILLQRVH